MLSAAECVTQYPACLSERGKDNWMLMLAPKTLRWKKNFI